MSYSGSRIHYLDSIRGIAAMMVIFYHFIGWQWSERFYIKLSFFVFNGSDAVSFFFVLSGFVLSFSYLHQGRKMNFFNYIWRRFWRLYPAFIFTVLLIFCYWNRDNFQFSTFYNAIVHNEGKLLTELAMVLHQHKYYIPGWTLGVEMIYSIIVVFLIPIVRLNRHFLIPLVLLSFFVGPAHLRIFMIHFCLGVLFAYYYPSIIKFDFKSSKIYTYRYLVYLATFILFSTRSIERLSTNLQEIYQGLFAQGFDHFHLSGIASFLILVFVAWNRRIQVFLENKLLLYIGKISYSIYLIHWLIILIIMNNWDLWARWLGYEKLRFVVMLIVFVLATLAAASLMYRYIEKPFIKFSKKKFIH